MGQRMYACLCSAVFPRTIKCAEDSVRLDDARSEDDVPHVPRNPSRSSVSTRARARRFVKGFSAADVMMSFPVISTANNWGLQKYPHLSSWLATIRERPAYKRAMEKAGGEFNM